MSDPINSVMRSTITARDAPERACGHAGGRAAGKGCYILYGGRGEGGRERRGGLSRSLLLAHSRKRERAWRVSLPSAI